MITNTIQSPKNSQRPNHDPGLFDIAGTLTMGASGTITNSGGDFLVDEQGYKVKTQASFSEPKSYKIVDSLGNVIGAFWATDTKAFLDGRGNNVTIQSIGGTVELSTSNRFVRVIDAGNVVIETSTGNLKLQSLPTSNPGGSNNVWNDGGFLRIT